MLLFQQEWHPVHMSFRTTGSSTLSLRAVGVDYTVSHPSEGWDHVFLCLSGKPEVYPESSLLPLTPNKSLFLCPSVLSEPFPSYHLPTSFPSPSHREGGGKERRKTRQTHKHEPYTTFPSFKLIVSPSLSFKISTLYTSYTFSTSLSFTFSTLSTGAAFMSSRNDEVLSGIQSLGLQLKS
jgi:hypothetical protein